MNAPAHNGAASPAATPVGVDNKEWARKILARHERGDRRLLPIQLKFAREALDVKAEVAA
ncbi:hypothetical protein [Massilia sp. METH4]|uniref:hypothetical protein n=1 Tax=Massilia sp. METH4 TaxID=3123041 RepID=UPI0030CA8962